MNIDLLNSLIKDNKFYFAFIPKDINEIIKLYLKVYKSEIITKIQPIQYELCTICLFTRSKIYFPYNKKGENAHNICYDCAVRDYTCLNNRSYSDELCANCFFTRPKTYFPYNKKGDYSHNICYDCAIRDYRCHSIYQSYNNEDENFYENYSDDDD